MMPDADELAVPPPGAQRLAVLLSVAVRIEPQLLRAVRLALLPGLEVGAESDLWFSDWVASHSTEMITLEPAVLPQLRRRLSDWLRDSGPDAGERLHAEIRRAHADISPALGLEEEAAWLAVSGGTGAAIETALAPALHALVAQGRNGVADWLLGAWERFPAQVQRTRVAWQLIQVSLAQRPGAAVALPAPPDDLSVADLVPIVDAVATVRIGVRRDGPVLSLGDLPDATAQIMVPDTHPRVVELAQVGGGPILDTVVVEAGEATSLHVGEAPLALRTGRGDVYRLDEPEGSGSELPKSEAPAAEPDLEPDPENLGAARYARYQETGDPALLNEAIELWLRALKTAGPRPALAVRAAEGLRSRYRLTGRAADLDTAISVCENAATSSEDTRQVLVALTNLLLERGTRNGDDNDLNRAIDIARNVIGRSHRGDFLLLPAMVALGSALLERARRLGDRDDVDAAVQLGETLVAETHPGDPRYPAAATLAGRALHARYRLTGALSDLDEAIELLAGAAEAATPPGAPAEVMVSLGVLLDERFLATGYTADLNRAVEQLRQAVTRVPAGSPLRAEARQSLSSVLLHRYEQLGDPADLDAAIDTARGVLADAPATALALAALGAALMRRGGSEDLDDAERALRQAVSMSSPTEPAVLIELANVLLRPRQDPDEARRVQEAIKFAEQAVSALPEESPARGGAQVTLAEALARSERLTGDRDAGVRAITTWRAVVQNTGVPAPARITAARAYAELAVRLGHLDTALTGYTAAVELLSLLGWQLGEPAELRRVLTDYAGLAQDAAACAISAGQPERALELLEHGRGLLWSHLLGQPADLARLQSVAPGIATELEQIRTVLNSDPSQSAASEGPTGPRRSLARRWDELVAQVRALPGFAAFLRPPDAASLRAAAVDGPVVVINVSSLRCDAMVVTTREVSVVPLPDVSHDAVARWVTEYLAGGRRDEARQAGSALHWLWDSIAEPVLTALGMTARERQPAPRLWWCTAGALSLVPLFAAGEPARSGPGRGVMDYVISSSTNTLGALIASRPRRGAKITPPRRLLVVTDPRGDLPGAAREADAIGQLFRELSKAEVTVLAGANATRQSVLASLPRHQWVHFSCHGIVMPDWPMDTGIVLADGVLTLADLVGARFANAELAFMGTCDTTASEFPDEAISVAGALQFAGFRHVIAGTRSLLDSTAAETAVLFYRRLFALPAESTPGVALDEALRQIRADSPDTAAWVSYVHYGP